MSSENLGVQPDTLPSVLHDPCNRPTREATRSNVAMTIDTTEQRARRDVGGTEPLANGGDGASRFRPPVTESDLATLLRLIGLGLANRDAKTVRSEVEIPDIETYQFASPECATEADKQERSVPLASDVRGQASQNGLEVTSLESPLLRCCDPMGSSDPRHHHRHLSALRRRRIPGKHVSMSNARHVVPSVLVAPGTTTWTVRRLGEYWTSNRLADESGGEVKPIDQSENARKLRKHVYPILFDGRTIGDIPVAEFTATHAKHVTRQATLPQGSKRAVGQSMKRMFKLAADVMEILPQSPLKTWRLPPKNDELDGAYLYPKEDAALLSCGDVPLVRRLYFGMAAREGIRRTRLAGLRWDRLRLSEHGHRGVARVPGKPNKKPVLWGLTDGTAEALRRWQRICPSDVWVFPAEALPRYRRSRAGQPIYVQPFAADLRDALKKAGVDRPELFESDEGFRRLVGHDLRATHVTLARANGVSDEVIRRRTRHTTTKMIDRYDHAVGLYEELDCGLLLPLHEAIPELAEMAPSQEWVEAGFAEPSDASIVGESSEDEADGEKAR